MGESQLAAFAVFGWMVTGLGIDLDHSSGLQGRALDIVRLRLVFGRYHLGEGSTTRVRILPWV